MQYYSVRRKSTDFDIIPLFFTLEAGRNPGRSRVRYSTQPIFISSIFFFIFPSQPANRG